MGCGKSKHDVVTGNTTRVRKPLEPESVKGTEKESIKRQESCRCQKTNDVSAAVSADRPETTVENKTKKPEEKEAGGDFGEKPAGETNDEQKSEEKETSTLPPVTEIVPENIVTEEKVNDVNESVLPVDEQKAEEVDIETEVEEAQKVTEDQVNSGDVDTEIPPPKVEEPKPEVETPVTTELEEVQETSTTENVETEIAATENVEIAATENVEVASTENDETSVLKEEDKVDVEEENPAKEVDSA